MFDIGFTELLLCLVVALIVIGPEQLPGTVRTVALWIGRLKRSLAETRSEIERQIGADDIRRQLHNEEILRSIEETRLQLEASLREHGTFENDYSTDTSQEHKPSASDYGPPDELPDHAHGDTASSATPAAAAPTTSTPATSATPKAPTATNALPSNSAVNVATSGTQTATTAPAPNNNQQSQNPAATAATPPANGTGH